MVMQKIIKRSSGIAGFTGLVKLSSLFKISFIVGSYTAFFSAISCVMPLSGAFTGLLGSCGKFSVISVVRFIVWGALPLHFLAYHIPGFCASLYWARPHNIFINVAIPLICMILFIVHPIGFYAAPYSFYWLIPIVLYFVSSKNLFLHALSSTFIAHAVGSVIWLYFKPVPMIVATWYMLLPVVAIERIAFALGMVVLYKVFSYVQQRITIRSNKSQSVAVESIQ
jgi:hypothetical protein